MSWSAVPLVALSALFVLALPLFALHVRRHGLPKDPRIEGRQVGPLLGRWLMYYLLWLIAPIERLLVRLAVPPNLLTLGSLMLAAGAATALGFGWFGLGGWLYVFTGIFDILDGRVARAGGRATRGGAFLDSVADRWAEALVFSGLGWYYRGSWVLLLVLAALATSFMVSYARARGEALGAHAGDAGAMQRPERILYVGVGTALSPLVSIVIDGGPHPLAAAGGDRAGPRGRGVALHHPGKDAGDLSPAAPSAARRAVCAAARSRARRRERSFALALVTTAGRAPRRRRCRRDDRRRARG